LEDWAKIYPFTRTELNAIAARLRKLEEVRGHYADHDNWRAVHVNRPDRVWIKNEYGWTVAENAGKEGA